MVCINFRELKNPTRTTRTKLSIVASTLHAVFDINLLPTIFQQKLKSQEAPNKSVANNDPGRTYYHRAQLKLFEEIRRNAKGGNHAAQNGSPPPI